MTTTRSRCADGAVVAPSGRPYPGTVPASREKSLSGQIIQGAVLRNAFNGETFTFSGPVDDRAVGRMEIRLAGGGSGGGNALVHVHPLADERFTVRSGRLKVVIDGAEHHAGPGQQIVVPRNRPHYFAGVGREDTEMTVEFTPAQDHMRFFANFATTTEKHPGWYSAKGEPAFLLIAMTLHVYRDHLYLAGIPRALQKILFALAAPIARLRGYRVEIPPRGEG